VQRRTSAGFLRHFSKREGPTVTEQLASKFGELAWEVEKGNRRLAALFRKLADRMRRCGEERRGYLWRCNSRCCPRCMRRKAMRDRRELERRLRKVASMERLRFVTLMVDASDLWEAWRVLGKALSLLLRRRFWVRAVVGASIHRDLVPSKGERCGPKEKRIRTAGRRRSAIKSLL
jgi:hypothetical protein